MKLNEDTEGITVLEMDKGEPLIHRLSQTRNPS